MFLGSVALRKYQQIRVTGVDDGHNNFKICCSSSATNNDLANAPNSEEFTGSGTKSDVCARKVVYRRLREHGIVFQLGFAQGGGITSECEFVYLSDHVSSRDLSASCFPEEA